MPSINYALQQFISSLELTESTKAQVTRQRDLLRAHIERELSVKEFLISGSFKRHTAIRPLNDVDLFVVLEPSSFSQNKVPSSKQMIKRLVTILDRAYPTKEKPKTQSRSVNIEFTGTGLAFDVVPAFPRKQGYIIPDREANEWIGTNPRVHAELSTRANEQAGKKAKPIVKALKVWKREQQPPKLLSSFHLELMVYDVLKSPPSSYADGIAQAFDGLARRVLDPMEDPAGLGPNVDARMTSAERRRAKELFDAACRVAQDAIDAERKGDTLLAHDMWRQLFGSAYPEK